MVTKEMKNFDRIFTLLREVAEECEIVNVYFQGFEFKGDLKPKFNYSFHREPLNAEPLEIKDPKGG